MKELITIIIRTFNNEDSILKSINSALFQSYKNLEILIINDGSSDQTYRLASTVFDNRLKIINQDNLGAIVAGYTGIQNATGKFITFLDADDELLPNAINRLYSPIKNSSYGFSYCDYYEVDLKEKTKKLISLSNFFNIIACGVLYKKEIINSIDFWDKNFILPEYDFILRVLQQYNGLHIEEPLYIYNRHSKSMTADKNLVNKAKMQIFAKYGQIDEFKEY